MKRTGIFNGPNGLGNLNYGDEGGLTGRQRPLYEPIVSPYFEQMTNEEGGGRRPRRVWPESGQDRQTTFVGQPFSGLGAAPHKCNGDCANCPNRNAPSCSSCSAKKAGIGVYQGSHEDLVACEADCNAKIRPPAGNVWTLEKQQTYEANLKACLAKCQTGGQAEGMTTEGKIVMGAIVVGFFGLMYVAIKYGKPYYGHDYDHHDHHDASLVTLKLNKKRGRK